MKPAWMSQKKAPWMYRCIHFFGWLTFTLFYRFRIYGAEHVKPGAAIIAANHVSFLDPPVVGIACPEETHFLARQTLFKNPILKWLLKNANTHPLKGDGGDASVFKTVYQLLHAGKKVVLFPEGTRSYDNKLSPIKPGIALFVSKTDAAVIPAYVFGTFETWPRGRCFPKIWKTVGCVFGSSFSWHQFSHLEKKVAQEQFAAALTTAILRLKTWYEEGAQGTPP